MGEEAGGGLSEDLDVGENLYGSASAAAAAAHYINNTQVDSMPFTRAQTRVCRTMRENNIDTNKYRH